MIGAIARLVVIEVASTVIGNAIYNKYKNKCDAGIKTAKDKYDVIREEARGVIKDVKKDIEKRYKKQDK